MMLLYKMAESCPEEYDIYVLASVLPIAVIQITYWFVMFNFSIVFLNKMHIL